MSRHPYDILSDIVVMAQRFSGNEAVLFERSPFADSLPLFQPMCEIEAGLAKSAHWFGRFSAEYDLAVAGLSPHPFPVRLRRELDAIKDMVADRLRRWRWDFVFDPSGIVAIDEKLKAHDESKYVAFLEAAISWRSGKKVTRHASADAFAREAELRGITPTMTPEEGDNAIWQRHKLWYLSPALSDAGPNVSADEHAQLGQAVDELMASFRREISPEQLREYAEQIKQQPARAPPAHPQLGRQQDLEDHESKTNGAAELSTPIEWPTCPAVDPGFITQKAACKFTALSKGYISRLCRAGVILTNGVKGRGMRLSAASLAEFMESRDKSN